MIKKIFLLFFILICFGFTCGCKDTKPRVYLSTRPLMRETFEPMNEFKKDDKINFILIVPKGFKADTVRLQLLKKSGLSPTFGYTLALGKDYNVENQHYLTGGFTVYSGGRYELMFFEPPDPDAKKTHFPAKQYFPKPEPLVDIEFGVYDN